MRNFKLLKPGSASLRQMCSAVEFSLNEKTKKNVQYLEQCFRQSFVAHNILTLGLSAPQVGINERFFIMPINFNYPKVPLSQLQYYVKTFEAFINPEIIKRSTEEVVLEETCLSVGSDSYYIQRAETILVRYQTLNGDYVERSLKGLKARVFLHEYDHLNGILVDTLESQPTPPTILISD